jgi:hypothetical protein
MLLDEVASYLEAEGIGVVKTTANDPAWPIHKGGLYPGSQAHPNDAIGLLEGPGDFPINEMGATVGSVVAETPSLVVHVRSASYATARSKADAAWGRLHKYAGTLGGVRYLLIEARQSPFPIGRDDAGRWIIGCNYGVTKERA